MKRLVACQSHCSAFTVVLTAVVVSAVLTVPHALDPAIAQTPAPVKAQAKIPPPPPAGKIRGWIGAEVRTVDEKRAHELNLAATAGAEIVSLVSFGPAAKSGLQAGDVILSADGDPVTTHAHLIKLISVRPPDDNVALRIARVGGRQTVTVTIGNYVDDQWIAAHRGDAIAMLNLGLLYSAGGLLARDGMKAREWMLKSANAGHARAMGSLGEIYQFGRGVERDDREALRWYRKAADAGDAQSIFAIGLFYYRGQGVARDYAEAVRWYRRAMEKNHSGAIHNYGVMLQDGLGIAKDEELAVDYFRRAATLGQLEAFPSIALAYYSGRGVAKDHAQALHWFRESVKRNVSVGYSGLGMMYERGEGGLSKNRAEAIKYYRKGAETGDQFSINKLKEFKTSVYDPKEVQQLLSDYGIDPGPINGRLTGRTRQAIRAFQKSRGLDIDGEASLRLVGQLRAALKQKTAAKTAAKEAAQPNTTTKTSPAPAQVPDLGNLKDLEKLDALD